MNVFLIILGIAAIITGIVLAIVAAYQKSEYGHKVSVNAKRITRLCVILGAVIFVAGFCFKIVPTGYTGVRTTFGQVSEQTVDKGFNLKIPFVQNIKLVNNKQQDTKVDTEVWGETTEKTPVFASDIIVTYQVSSSKSAWLYTNVSNPDNLIEQSLVASAIKSSMVEMSVKDVTNRSKIEPSVKEALQVSLNEKYGEDTISILKVVINNMDFEASYNEAIAAKSIAQQAYEKQQIENETAIAKAEADKKVSIANAEAKAQATLIEAQAEADANKLLVESLTDAVLRSKFYEKWDGKLPTVMGENTVITDVGQTN